MPTMQSYSPSNFPYNLISLEFHRLLEILSITSTKKIYSGLLNYRPADLWDIGGNPNTWREPMQTMGVYANFHTRHRRSELNLFAGTLRQQLPCIINLQILIDRHTIFRLVIFQPHTHSKRIIPLFLDFVLGKIYPSFNVTKTDNLINTTLLFERVGTAQTRCYIP